MAGATRPGTRAAAAAVVMAWLLLRPAGGPAEAASGPAAGAAPAALVAEVASYVVTPGQGSVSLLYLLRLRNGGPGPTGPLRWALPPGAMGARLLAPGEGLRVGEAEVIDPAGLTPGASREYAVSFQLPVGPARTTPIELPIAAPTRELLVLVDEAGLSVRGVDGLQPGGVVDFQGRSLLRYGATDVPPGAVPRLLLVAAPRGRPAVRERLREAARALAGNPWFLASAAVALAGTGAYVAASAWLRRGAGGPASPAGGAATTGGATPADLDRLIAELAALDLMAEDGEIEPERYRSERAALKKRLLEAAERRGQGPAQ